MNGKVSEFREEKQRLSTLRIAYKQEHITHLKIALLPFECYMPDIQYRRDQEVSEQNLRLPRIYVFTHVNIFIQKEPWVTGKALLATVRKFKVSSAYVDEVRT